MTTCLVVRCCLGVTSLRHGIVSSKVSRAELSFGQRKAVCGKKLCDALTGRHSCPTPGLTSWKRKLIWCECGVRPRCFLMKLENTVTVSENVWDDVNVQKSKHASLRVRRGNISAFRHNPHQPAPALKRPFQITNRHFYWVHLLKEKNRDGAHFIFSNFYFFFASTFIE